MSGNAVRMSIVGMPELQKRLAALEPSVRKKVLRPAVTAAARPIRMAAKRNVPVRYGLLKKAIDVKAKSYKETAVAIVGARSDMKFSGKDLFGRTVVMKPSKYAHLVEYGTKPHMIVMRARGGKKIRFMHRGSPGTHFMERAFGSSSGQASHILNQRIAEGLERVA